jgi:hypothetical protein
MPRTTRRADSIKVAPVATPGRGAGIALEVVW